MTDEDDRLVPLSRLAARAGVSQPTARRYVERGLVPATNTSTSERPVWKVRESDIDRFLASRYQPASR